MICIQSTAVVGAASSARRARTSCAAVRAAPVAAKLAAKSAVASTSALSQGRVHAGRLQAARAPGAVRVYAGSTAMEFIKGISETSVPEVKLTRSRDGGSGTAMFYFENPDVFEMQSGGASGDITGLYMTDEEGTMSTVDVSARFVNGKPKGIEAKYLMKSAFEWDRFMRFMERYAEDNALGFSKSK